MFDYKNFTLALSRARGNWTIAYAFEEDEEIGIFCEYDDYFTIGSCKRNTLALIEELESFGFIVKHEHESTIACPILEISVK